MDMLKLRSCPFCGGKPKMHVNELFIDFSAVECPTCNAIVSFVDAETPEETAEMYNRRAADGLDSIY